MCVSAETLGHAGRVSLPSQRMQNGKQRQSHDVQGGAPINGAAVIYIPCDGAPSQNWTASNSTIMGICEKCLDIGSTWRPGRAGPAETSSSQARRLDFELEDVSPATSLLGEIESNVHDFA
jgi:hypothetical protein